MSVLRIVLFLCAVVIASAQPIRPVLGFAAPYASGFTPIQAMTVDAAGNIYITGATTAAIPLVNAVQPALGGGNCGISANRFAPCEDAFVAKYDPTGKILLYSTYLGGDTRDFPAGLAVDRSGNLYVAITARPASYMMPLAGQTRVYKLNPNGSAILYTQTIVGNTSVRGIAVDAQGNAFVAGMSIGADFPAVNGLQSQAPLKSVIATSDAGVTWRIINNNLRALSVYSVAVDPTRASTLYAGTSSGLFKSLDTGASWTQLLPETTAQVTIDPRNSPIVYARHSGSRLAKSVDGGATWQDLTANLPPSRYTQEQDRTLGAFAIDPSNSSVLWVVANSVSNPAILKSTDAGATWISAHDFPAAFIGDALSNDRSGITIDPANSSRIYVCCTYRIGPAPPGVLWRTNDAGETWTAVGNSPETGIGPPVIDPRNPGTLYSQGFRGLSRSTDNGQTWIPVALPAGAPPADYETGSLAIDSAGTIYLANSSGLLLRSGNSGATWTTLPGPWEPRAAIAGIDPVRPGSLYIGIAPAVGPQHAFAARLDPSGDVQWSTLLAGSRHDEALAIAVDAQGNPYVTGLTKSPDFPTANPLQAALARSRFDGSDAFVTKVSADGRRLLYSTWLGGSGEDRATAIAVDSEGRAYVAGATNQDDFPTANALQAKPDSLIGASFVAKLDSDGRSLLYSTYLSGAGYNPFNDTARAIALDTQGRVWIAGKTGTYDFPLAQHIQPSLGPGGDAYIVRLSQPGTRLALDFSTFFGGVLTSIAVAPTSSIWVAGIASSNDVVGALYFDTGFIARLDLQMPQPQPGVPVLSALYNAASYRLGDVVSPGQIVSIFGAELAPATEPARSLPLPATLQDVTVTVGGLPAPLFLVSPGQINFQVPTDLPLGDAILMIRRNTQTVERRVRVIGSTPAIFTANGEGRGQPVIVHAADYSLVTTDNPARPGEYLVIFCTGLGATAPRVRAGDAAPLAPVPLEGRLDVVISSRQVDVTTYAGLAPGFAGLYQVNFKLRDNEPPGMHALYISTAFASSNVVPFFIR